MLWLGKSALDSTLYSLFALGVTLIFDDDLKCIFWTKLRG